MRRRSAASASWARVAAFSFTSIASRADSHCCAETIGGVFLGSDVLLDDVGMVDLLLMEQRRLRVLKRVTLLEKMPPVDQTGGVLRRSSRLNVASYAGTATGCA